MGAPEGGLDTLFKGATVTSETLQGERGPQVARILAVDVAAAPKDGAGDGQRRGAFPGPAQRDGGAAGLSMQVRSTVKFYDPARGFGFVVPDDGGAEVFVHESAVSRSGVDDLQAGQRVSVWVEDAPRGPQATEVQPIRGFGLGDEPSLQQAPESGGRSRSRLAAWRLQFPSRRLCGAQPSHAVSIDGLV